MMGLDDRVRRMKAKHVLLNHFSQRYPKGVHFDLKTIDPTSPPDVQANAAVQVIGLALDLIRVPIGEMWKLRAYYPAVSMLNDDGVEEEGGEGEGGDDEGAGLLQEEGKEGKGGGKKEKPKKEKKEKVAKGGGGAQEGQGEKKQKKKKGGNGGGPAPLELASDLA
jgi:ribonuclease Z